MATGDDKQYSTKNTRPSIEAGRNGQSRKHKSKFERICRFFLSQALTGPHGVV